MLSNLGSSVLTYSRLADSGRSVVSVHSAVLGTALIFSGE